MSRLKIKGFAAPSGPLLSACDSVRRALRSATGPAHARLHTNVAFAALLRGDLSRPGYTGLLQQLYGLHLPIEKRLARFCDTPSMAWWEVGAAPSRASQLRYDLKVLGVDEAMIAATAQADVLLPTPSCPAGALGCAWVVEGSALGGRFMASQVVAILGEGWSERGGAFFASSSNQSSRWRLCCDAVESYRDDPTSIDAMVGAAVQTFEAFELWLDTAVCDQGHVPERHSQVA